MKLVHRLRGYDKHDSTLKVQYDIPPSLVPLLREVVQPSANDQEFIDPYSLTVSKARAIAKAIGDVFLDTDRFDFFSEATADWETIRNIKKQSVG